MSAFSGVVAYLDFLEVYLDYPCSDVTVDTSGLIDSSFLSTDVYIYIYIV